MINQPKRSRKPETIFLVSIVLALFSSCFKTYHLSNGETKRNFFPVKDVHFVSDKELEEHKFDYTLFKNADTTNPVVQFITPTDLSSISDSIQQDFLVIFYYPNCTNINKELGIANFAEKNGIPYILISYVYNPQRTRLFYTNSGLKNQNHYVIPSFSRKDKLVLVKKRDFIRKCCPTCYDLVKDELIYSTLLKFSTEKNGVTEPKVPYGKIEGYTNWIKQQFNLISE